MNLVQIKRGFGLRKELGKYATNQMGTWKTKNLKKLARCLRLAQNEPRKQIINVNIDQKQISPLRCLNSAFSLLRILTEYKQFFFKTQIQYEMKVFFLVTRNILVCQSNDTEFKKDDPKIKTMKKMMVHVAPKRNLIIFTFIVKCTSISIVIRLKKMMVVKTRTLSFLLVGIYTDIIKTKSFPFLYISFAKMTYLFSVESAINCIKLLVVQV